MEQIFNILRILPGYLVFLSIFLVIIPSILSIISRFSLHQNLSNTVKNLKRLLDETGIERKPNILHHIEKRLELSQHQHESINTTAIIDGSYSQEKCRILGMSFSCEAVDYLTRLLPNLLLSFGLLGTFLGITINLATLSQTITQVDITDLNSLVEELDKPLQGMGVAFVSSLVAIACSALLTVINLIWNTNLVKATLLSFIEDYLDNVYLPQRQQTAPIDIALERFSNDFSYMLDNLSSTIENSITNAFSKIEDTADTFQSAANTLEQSRLPEKLSSATTDLAIAQNQFSQSSLVLQRSTQSFENSLDGIQKVINKISKMEDNVEKINHKYDNLLELSKNTNEIN
ncbi:hypothetical protein Xen7305DRAFT_00002990 [Xenococcus sp. PCC 7305]|uniref:methyl-accepting chemotaxis protein n=1 Tax=Xenococcus sp. PCC 7305 TaxID=102125 RepID=UPI0002ABD93A|nr:methyl-accepting chemotaxis protein [Xenococcus sp. PCC 7305]ELS00598.1 hypothetical protein Xen7305DRAFT_00002990 [Xenococcus sp. PCC 7305]